jgi:hypothetical protein
MSELSKAYTKKEDFLARENYSYKKFQRELAQKKKREEKLKRKQEKKNSADGLVSSDPVVTEE